jgi:hypothetical protein
MYSEKIARYAIYSWVGSWHYGIMIRGNSLKIFAYLIEAICQLTRLKYIMQFKTFLKAILHAHTVDDSILYLDNRNKAYAE